MSSRAVLDFAASTKAQMVSLSPPEAGGALDMSFCVLGNFSYIDLRQAHSSMYGRVLHEPLGAMPL